MDDRFLVFPLTAGEFNQLLNLVQPRLVALGGLGTGSIRSAPLTATLTHIAQLGARCLIIQTDVQDPDFLDEHAAYYARWSFKVPRYCDRLHFFSQEPSSDNALNVIDQMADTPNSYLGFITLRPIRVSPLAASILKPPTQERFHFVLAKDEFQVNLAGQTFAVNGTPFMQQDNAVGACAQAAIWMALRTLRRKEGQSAFSPAQITSAATRFLVRGRVLPNRDGLGVEQMTEALRTAGYAPHIVPLRGYEEPATETTLLRARQALYPYMESGLPVLLMLALPNQEGHAVLLIGHGWNPTPARLIENTQIQNPTLTAPISVLDASSWADPLFIHNDNSGPYLPLANEEPTPFNYALSHAVSAIPFLQPDVFIDGAEAKLTCLRLLHTLLGNFDYGEGPTPAAPPLPSFVTRLYLQEKADFRKEVLESTMPDELKAYYRQKWLPKRIWVMEINSYVDYHLSPDRPLIRLGEILLDPASEPEDAAFLTIHVGIDLLPQVPEQQAVVVDRNAFTGEIQALAVSSRPYAPRVRSPN